MTETTTYTPPTVWTWNKANGGRFANINRPIAGATYEKDLPVGNHPMQLYSLATPNGVKVTVMLEELLALGHAGAEYDAWLIKINEGEQFGSGFVAVNPNSKIPALMDRSGPTPIRVFESGAILLHLAHKFNAFLPESGSARAECLSWLFWQMGSAPYLGGGFGQKTGLYPEDGIVAYAAVKLGRKIRWRGERTDEFVGGTHGRDLTSTGEFALDEKGRVQAFRVRSIGGTGAYLTGTGAIIPLVLGPFVATGVYDLPLVHFDIKAVMTNTAPVGAYRGAGRPEAVFIVERLMDAAARQLGMDPRAIRKANFIKPAQLPYTNAAGQVYDSGAFAHMLDRATKLADWDGYAARKKAATKKGLLYGRGLTSYIEWTGGRAHTESVSLHATAEGRIVLYSGTQAMGQGLETSYAQMIAASLGVSIDKIDVVQGDTDLAQGFGSVGSRSLFVGGTAVAVSTTDLIAKAREKASHVLETSVEDIEYVDGWLTVVGTDRRVSLFEIAKDEKGARLSVDSTGEVDGPSWPNGVHICEVEIDPETGITNVVKYTTVDDVGVAVNPMLVAGQVHGGVAQGIGQALYEGVAYSAEGQLLTATYQDYCIPRASDVPSIEVTLDGSAPCRTNPLGAKGCGESGAIGGPPCITNGVMDALSPLGIKTLQTPLSPIKVWQAIRDARSAQA